MAEAVDAHSSQLELLEHPHWQQWQSYRNLARVQQYDKFLADARPPGWDSNGTTDETMAMSTTGHPPNLLNRKIHNEIRFSG